MMGAKVVRWDADMHDFIKVHAYIFTVKEMALFFQVSQSCIQGKGVELGVTFKPAKKKRKISTPNPNYRQPAGRKIKAPPVELDYSQRGVTPDAPPPKFVRPPAVYSNRSAMGIATEFRDL